MLITDAVAGTNVRTVSWWRVAAAGDPASWTWTPATSASMTAAIVAYSGVDTISPVVVLGIANHTTNTSTHVAPSVTSTVTGGVQIAIAGVSSTTTTTPAAGLTERVDKASTSSNGVTLHIGDRTQPGSGATGTSTITSAANGRAAMQTLLLRPGTLINTTVTAHRYSYSASGDTGDVVIDTNNVVIERSFSLPGGVIVTDRGPTGDVWSYPNIHGDTQAVANSTGVKQGATLTYDPYGNPLAGIVDNQAGEFDNAWLGQHQRPLEHQTGLTPTIEMGARPYNPTLGRFVRADPIEGGNSNAYVYVDDPVNQYDLDGQWCRPKRLCRKAKQAVKKVGKVVKVTSRAVVNAPITVAAVGYSVVIGGGSCSMAAGLMVTCTGNRAWANGPGDFLTMGNAVITERPSVSAAVLNHEQEHATQWSFLGPAFPIAYVENEILSQLAGQGSCWNYFERSAPPNARYDSC